LSVPAVCRHLINIYRQGVGEKGAKRGALRVRTGSAECVRLRNLSMKFVIAAGGTGGHLFPGLAWAKSSCSRARVMVLISEKEIDALATQGRTEFRIESSRIGMPKLFSPAIIGFLGRFKAGLDQCGRCTVIFSRTRCWAWVAFTSTAPILAGRLRKVPYFRSRIERDSREGEPAQCAARHASAARLSGVHEIFPHAAV
jgi:UDP-N-acetylglucosamine--N-acetylmuramyl-(pentapeptide) pyrophosphoryl-undecaprenol N-acetylglucosamine transferase